MEYTINHPKRSLRCNERHHRRRIAIGFLVKHHPLAHRHHPIDLLLCASSIPSCTWLTTAKCSTTAAVRVVPSSCPEASSGGGVWCRKRQRPRQQQTLGSLAATCRYRTRAIARPCPSKTHTEACLRKCSDPSPSGAPWPSLTVLRRWLETRPDYCRQRRLPLDAASEVYARPITESMNA